MTKKSYPHGRAVSRFAASIEDRRIPSAYRALSPESGEHPVDMAIDQMRDIKAARRRLHRRSEYLRKCSTDAEAFIAYEDAWSNYCIVRDQRYFDLGYRNGTVAGRAESLAASATKDANVRAFAHQICHAAAMADLSQERLAATMMEVARAIVLGLPMP
jgi:hypothetical protein